MGERNAKLVATILLLAALALGVESTVTYTTRSHPTIWTRLQCHDRIRFADVKKIAFTLGDDACSKNGNQTLLLASVQFATPMIISRYDAVRGRSARVECETKSRRYEKSSDVACRLVKTLSASGIYYPASPKSFSFSFSNQDQVLKSMKFVVELDFDEGFLEGEGLLIGASAVFVFIAISICCAMDVYLARTIGNLIRFRFAIFWFFVGVAICTIFIAMLSVDIILDMRLWPATKREFYPLYCSIVFVLLPFHPIVTVPLIYMIVEMMECVLVVCGARPDENLVMGEPDDEDVYNQVSRGDEENDAGSNEISDSDDDMDDD